MTQLDGAPPPPPSAAAAAAAPGPAPTSPAATSPLTSPSGQQIVHFTYDQIHQQIADAVEGPRSIFQHWRPTLLLCISGGGLVPTRILRSCLRRVAQREAEAEGKPAASVGNVAVQCVGLQLYDTEGLDPATSAPLRTQWIEHDAEAAARWWAARYEAGGGKGAANGHSSNGNGNDSSSTSRPPLCLQGQRVLVVDEVDDSRATLAACCAELERDAAREKAAYERLRAAANEKNQPLSLPEWQEPEIGVFVCHNKRRVKRGVLPDAIIMRGRYFAASYISDVWIRYPWDADCIETHSRVAREQHSRARCVLPLPANGEEGQHGEGDHNQAAAAEGGRARRRTDAAAPELVI